MTDRTDIQPPIEFELFFRQMLHPAIIATWVPSLSDFAVTEMNSSAIGRVKMVSGWELVEKRPPNLRPLSKLASCFFREPEIAAEYCWLVRRMAEHREEVKWFECDRDLRFTCGTYLDSPFIQLAPPDGIEAGWLDSSGPGTHGLIHCYSRLIAFEEAEGQSVGADRIMLQGLFPSATDLATLHANYRVKEREHASALATRRTMKQMSHALGSELSALYNAHDRLLHTEIEPRIAGKTTGDKSEQAFLNRVHKSIEHIGWRASDCRDKLRAMLRWDEADAAIAINQRGRYRLREPMISGLVVALVRFFDATIMRPPGDWVRNRFMSEQYRDAFGRYYGDQFKLGHAECEMELWQQKELYLVDVDIEDEFNQWYERYQQLPSARFQFDLSKVPDIKFDGDTGRLVLEMFFQELFLNTLKHSDLDGDRVRIACAVAVEDGFLREFRLENSVGAAVSVINDDGIGTGFVKDFMSIQLGLTAKYSIANGKCILGGVKCDVGES